MLKYVLIAVGLLIILISLIVIVGMLLPKSHTATLTAKYARSQDEVWDALTDMTAQSEWRSGVSEMKRLEDREGHEVLKEVRGRGDSITYRIVAREPPRMLKTRIVDNKQFGGTWTWVVEPVDETNCVLRITEDGEIYNPIFKFVARFIMGYQATMKGWLTDLAGHFDQPVQFAD